MKKNKTTKTTEEKTNTWLDYAATSYDSGDGSQNNPYLISTASQLALVSKQYRYGGGRNVYFKLVKDIDLSAHNWFPIGAGKDVNSVFIENFRIYNFEDEAITKYRFFGNIDGNGKTISGLKIISSGDFIGFIAINEDNVIKNLNFKNVSISARNGCGVVAGYNRLNSKIINCSVEGTVNANTTEPLGAMCGKNYSGGKIVGCSAPFVLCNENQGTISRCYNPKGLFNISYGIVSDCYTQGKIDSRVIYHSYCEYEKNGQTVATVYEKVYGNINNSKEVSSARLTDKMTFSSWDFSKIWSIDSKKK